MLKIVLLSSFMFVFSSYLQAQIWREVTPLKSTRQDVIKAFKEEQQLPNGNSIFDSQKDTITIKYYSGGCSKLEEEELGLSPDIVIEMTGVPKIELPLAVLSRNTINDRKKITLSNWRNMYIDFNVGFLVVTETPKDKPELVTTFFYIPKRVTKLPPCLLKKMDPLVQQAFELNKVNEQEIKGVYFSESVNIRYPEFSRFDLKQFAYFINLLKKAENSKGYIIVYAGIKARRNEAAFWIKKLKKHLIEENKINEASLSFINGGFRKSTIATLLILPVEAEPPKPSPTILPSQVEIVPTDSISKKRRNR